MKEILAPVGDKEMLMAAINSGADAVYLGASKFNARMKAENFNSLSLEESVKLAHLYNTKVYLTLNTLVGDKEIPDLIDTINEAVKAKVDAFIVQDYGTSYILKKYYPNAVLHASTQLGVHNKEGAIVAEKMGFKRVVLSREATLEDIRQIKKATNLEIEYFVHGALCVAFSGNCYLSSFVKNKSGNRGECLQLCRLFYSSQKNTNRGWDINYDGLMGCAFHTAGTNKYNKGLSKIDRNCKINTSQLVTKNDKNIQNETRTQQRNDKIKQNETKSQNRTGNNLLKNKSYLMCDDTSGYLLSTRDLCYLNRMKELIDAGVDSFKIEGRLKRPSYVALTTKLYKKAISGETIAKQDEENLRLVFSRGEFNKGRYLDNKNDNIINKTSQSHLGLKIGKVIKTEKFKDLHKIFIKSDYDINVGDGLKFISSDNFVNSMGVGNVEKVKGLQVVYSKCYPSENDDVYLTLKSTLENELLSITRKIKVHFSFIGKVGENAKLTICLNDKKISDKTISFTTKSDYICEQAKSSGVTKDNIIKNLSKLGETPFIISDIDVNIDDNLFIPLVEINKLRRECTNKLQELIITNNTLINQKTVDKQVIINELSEIKYQYENNRQMQTISDKISYITTENHKIENNTQIVIISPEIYNISNIVSIIEYVREQNKQAKMYLDLPIIECYKDIEILNNILGNFKDLGVVVNNIYGLNLVNDRDVILGTYLNISNSFAYKHLTEFLGKENVLAFKSNEYFCDIDYLPSFNGEFALMTMKHCPFKVCYGANCDNCSYSKGLSYTMQSGQEFVIKRKKIFNCYFSLISEDD